MNKVKFILLLTCVAVFAQQKDTFTDSRDGKTYKTVKIGKQVWMAQNLDYHGSDGYLGLCYGANPKKEIMNLENCKSYGRLYDWKEANQACPKGWHLPNNDEWQTLVDFAGGKEIAGKKLKAKSGWKEYDFSEKNPGSPKCKWTEQTEKQIDNRGRVISPAGVVEHDNCATDEFGFSALPGGDGGSDGSFRNVGSYGGWWSANGYGSFDAYHRNMNYYSVSAYWYNSHKASLFSVRCVWD